MNEDLDLTKILKDVPRGTKFWSPICGDCTFERIDYDPDTDYPIVCSADCIDGELDIVAFTTKGVYDNRYVHGCCAIFPSEKNRDWTKFEAPKKHNTKKHKEFKPFEKVLVKELVGRHCEKAVWLATEYSHYDEGLKQHYCTQCYGFDDDDIIPYEGNEDMVGRKESKIIKL